MKSLALLIVMTIVMTGCTQPEKLDIWQGTYESGGGFLVDTSFSQFDAELEQTDPETGYVEKAKVSLTGYSSETAEVLSVFLNWLGGNFTIMPKE